MAKPARKETGSVAFREQIMQTLKYAIKLFEFCINSLHSYSFVRFPPFTFAFVYNSNFIYFYPARREICKKMCIHLARVPIRKEFLEEKINI